MNIIRGWLQGCNWPKPLAYAECLTRVQYIASCTTPRSCKELQIDQKVRILYVMLNLSNPHKYRICGIGFPM
jgi:hypothetical protein